MVGMVVFSASAILFAASIVLAMISTRRLIAARKSNMAAELMRDEAREYIARARMIMQECQGVFELAQLVHYGETRDDYDA